MIDYFLHIPKTGGTSFTNILDVHYKKEEILPYQGWTAWLPHYGQTDLSKIKLVRGHFGYGLYHSFGTPDALRYMTMLRNPVERVISAYHHISVDKERNNWHFDFPFDTLENLLETQSFLFSNKQLRHIAVDINVPELGKDESFDYVNSQYLFKETDYSVLFDWAIAHLGKFMFVGFMEEYNKSVDKLCDIMCWAKCEVPHLNVLPNRPATNSLPAHVVKKIEALNEWDFKLYDYAKGKFF